MDRIDQACRLHDRADRDFTAGRLTSAERACRTALVLMRRSAGLRHPDSVNIANTLAAILEARGRYSEALEIRRQSVRDAPDGQEIELRMIRVQSWEGLGNLLRVMGRYREARPVLRRGLELSERTLGPRHQQTAACLNDLGVLDKYTGRFSEGMKFYQRALRIARAAGDQQLIATIYHNIGGLEHARGRFAAGVAPSRRALELRRNALGANHPAVAADAAALAGVLDGLRRYGESRRLYAMALRVFRRCYGPVNYDVAVNLNNLACIESDCGRHAQAEALFRESLAMKEKLLGKNHPDTALSLHNLSTCLRDQERYGEARACARRALRALSRRLPESNPKVQAVKNVLKSLENR